MGIRPDIDLISSRILALKKRLDIRSINILVGVQIQIPFVVLKKTSNAHFVFSWSVSYSYSAEDHYMPYKIASSNLSVRLSISVARSWCLRYDFKLEGILVGFLLYK